MCRSIGIKFVSWTYMYTKLNYYRQTCDSNISVQMWRKVILRHIFVLIRRWCCRACPASHSAASRDLRYIFICQGAVRGFQFSVQHDHPSKTVWQNWSTWVSRGLRACVFLTSPRTGPGQCELASRPPRRSPSTSVPLRGVCFHLRNSHCS